eukprot:2858891-Pleurochrysis_carterae.AAC.1
MCYKSTVNPTMGCLFSTAMTPVDRRYEEGTEASGGRRFSRSYRRTAVGTFGLRVARTFTLHVACTARLQ